MNSINSIKYFRFIAFMLMASNFLPLIFNNLPPVVRSHHVWTALWAVSLVLFYPRVFTERLMLHVLLYGLFILVLFFLLVIDMDDWNKRMLIREFYAIAIAVSVITYFQIRQDYIGLAIITKWVLIFLIFTAIMTIVSANIDPLYARKLTGISSVKDEEARDLILSMRRYGGGDYATAIAFFGFIPLTYLLSQKHRTKYCSKEVCCCNFLLVFFSLTSYADFWKHSDCFFMFSNGLLGTKKYKKIYNSCFYIPYYCNDCSQEYICRYNVYFCKFI